MRFTDLIQTALRRGGYDLVRHRLPVHSPPFGLLSVLIRDELTRTPDFTFMQIGANDGLSDDHLRPAILAHRLRGVLVEPIPEMFAALQRNYADQPQLRFAHCAIAERDGDATMYRIRAGAPVPESAQQLASFDRHHCTTGRQGVPGLDAYIEAVQVPARSLSSLLHAHGLPQPTALIMDAEGFDGAIVRMALDAGLRPRLLMYEHAVLPPLEQRDLLCRLKAAGYAFVEVGMDTYATHRRNLATDSPNGTASGS